MSQSGRRQRQEAAQRRIQRDADLWDDVVTRGNAITTNARGVTVRLALGLASDAEIRDALDTRGNPYADTGALVTQCMLAGRWDLIS